MPVISNDRRRELGVAGDFRRDYAQLCKFLNNRFVDLHELVASFGYLSPTVSVTGANDRDRLNAVVVKRDDVRVSPAC